MSEYFVKLRYYPGDAYEKIENREIKEGLLMENTLEKKIEEISQEVITVSGDKEKRFSDCIRALYKRYRCPRTVYSLLGSNEAGEKIAKGLMNLYGGW